MASFRYRAGLENTVDIIFRQVVNARIVRLYGVEIYEVFPVLRRQHISRGYRRYSGVWAKILRVEREQVRQVVHHHRCDKPSIVIVLPNNRD
jgi:hypothetical protein